MATNLNNLSVDFTPYARDFRAIADTRLLAQFYKSDVMKQVIYAFADEAQELYDAIIELQRRRCVAYADGYWLEGIGRIVGQPKVQYEYDDTMYFIPDTAGQSVDQGIAWVQNAPVADTSAPTDDIYRMQILGKIQNNMNRFSSIPELKQQVGATLGIPISVELASNPAEVNILVTDAASETDKFMLESLRSISINAEDAYFFPYPAGVKVAAIVTSNPTPP